MKKPCRKCAPKVNSRPLLNLIKQPKTAIACKEFFYKSDILKENYQKASKKITLFLIRIFASLFFLYAIRMSLVCTRVSSVCH